MCGNDIDYCWTRLIHTMERIRRRSANRWPCVDCASLNVLQWVVAVSYYCFDILPISAHLLAKNIQTLACHFLALDTLIPLSYTDMYAIFIRQITAVFQRLLWLLTNKSCKDLAWIRYVALTVSIMLVAVRSPSYQRSHSTGKAFVKSLANIVQRQLQG